MANEIVWYHSDEAGAPVLNNAAGSLDAVLYACLVTGFRPQTLTSVSVTANVATATLAGHGYDDQKMLELAGAATGAINGRKLITKTGSGTFTFPAPGVADGAVGGVITAKRSPLGWARSLTSGNVSIYARTDPAATAMGLRVDDSAAGTTARVTMLETWGGDVNTFTGQAPTAGQIAGGMYWAKGANNASAKKWALVGDSRTFYLLAESANYPQASYSNQPAGIYAFGDIEPYRAGAAYDCVLSGGSAGGDGAGLGNVSVLSTAGLGVTNLALSRSYSALGVAVGAAQVGAGGGNMGGYGPVYPSPVDNGMVIATPLFLNESIGSFGYPLRGALRGIGNPLATIPTGALDRTVLTAVTGSSRAWLMLAFQRAGASCHAAFDVTGPWA